MVLKIGQRFKSYTDLIDALSQYKKTNFNDFWIRDNRTLKTAKKR